MESFNLLSDNLDAFLIIGALFIIAAILAFPYLPWKEVAITSLKNGLPFIVAIILGVFISVILWGIVEWQNFTPQWIRIPLLTVIMISLAFYFNKKYNKREN